ncbi:MAG: type II toxin-antitoxin system RelE/ParE family toxin [Sphingomicrobium sp.]
MRRLKFRKQALTDLEAIVAWHGQVAPEAVPRLLDDIYRALDLLIDFPRAGMAVPSTRFRRIVTRRYHFKIAYEIAGDSVAVIGIFRFQNRSI